MDMKRILIADDNTELRKNLSIIVEELGYSPDTASTGTEAISKAMANAYDIVLLDLMLPEINGMDVLGQLRANVPRSKCIIITAFASIDTAVEAIKKGASYYISKPFEINDLSLTIKKTLEEAKFDRDLKKLHLDDTLGSISNQIRRDILKLLTEHKRMRLMEITKELDIEDHTKIVFHLRILRESGIIDQKDRTYYITNEGARVCDALRIIEKHISG